MAKYRSASSRFQSIDDQEDDEEEDLQRRIEGLETMLSRAEQLRAERLELNVRRLHFLNNEQIAIKQAAKRGIDQKFEHKRLTEMVMHGHAILKKVKRRAEFMKEVKDDRANSNLDKNEHKKMRLSDIQR